MSTFQQDLQALRAQIDDVDHELLQSLKRRAEISTAIGRLKLENGRGIVDAAREDEMVAARASAGCSLGLPEDWTSDLFKTVLKGCVAISHERLGAVAE